MFWHSDNEDFTLWLCHEEGFAAPIEADLISKPLIPRANEVAESLFFACRDQPIPPGPRPATRFDSS